MTAVMGIASERRLHPRRGHPAGSGKDGLRWRAATLATATALVVAACSGGGEGGDDDRADGDDRDAGPEVAESEALEGQDAGDDEDEPQVELREFVSRPDITPPVMDVEASGSTAPGLLVLAPKQAGAQTGALIMDNEGRGRLRQPAG